MIQIAHSRQEVVVEFIAFLFIVLFVYAAVSKILAFHAFQITLGQSPLLTPFAGWLAWFVPTLELIVCLLLATSSFLLLGLFLSFGLMVLFTGYIVAILQYADFVPCSCGGVLESMSWEQHLWFNGFFVLLAIAGIFLHSSKGKVDPLSKLIKTFYCNRIRRSRKPVNE